MESREIKITKKTLKRRRDFLGENLWDWAFVAAQ
jgi:hypothetical protein